MTHEAPILFSDAISDGMIDWRSPPQVSRLSPYGVHLWRVALDGRFEDSMEVFYGILGEDERARASRFRFEVDRRRYVIGRALLRSILARYLSIPPESLHFAYSKRGKPSLVGNDALQFNASHCRDLYVLAVSDRRPVGIDVERLELPPEYPAIAGRCFRPEEAQALASSPLMDRADMFFRCWTALEARSKATGLALGECMPNETCTNTVAVHYFIPAANHVAALARINVGVGEG